MASDLAIIVRTWRRRPARLGPGACRGSAPRGAGLLQRRGPPGQVLEHDLQADARFGIDRLAGRAGIRDGRAGPVPNATT